jgi:transposase
LIEVSSARKEKVMKKKLNTSFKLKITLEAIKGDMTIGEIASRYEVSLAQIHRWKRVLLE